MTKRHWRELVEIVGVVAIVAALLLVAAQVRRSNHIAAAQATAQITASFSQLSIQRATNPEFAKLFPKLEAPESHLTTATEASQIRGIAWHYFDVMRLVQDAYENGLIDRQTYDDHISRFAYTIEKWPGIRSHYVQLFQDMPSLQGDEVFAPIVNYIAAQQAEAE